MSPFSSALALNLTCSSIVSLFIATSFVAFVGAIVHRLYFHPLSKFPGPKLAALTEWYESYWDIIKHGQYTFEIGRMHEKYGKELVSVVWELKAVAKLEWAENSLYTAMHRTSCTRWTQRSPCQ